MLRRFTLIIAFSAFSWSSNALALGLGDIQLNSALNEPLDAQIELLSATQEELKALEINMAPAATFERYGLDRAPYLSGIRFEVVATGTGGVIRMTSSQSITEPFVTMLVEAVWPRGRLLREYTVLLDPPIFAENTRPAPAPQASRQAPATNQGTQRVRRPSSQPQARQQQPVYDGDTYSVQRSDTLWQIAERVRPASDLSINQVMLSLYEANPGAFAGNINLVNAGATLRIPSAAEMQQRNRGTALSEVRRQNQAWQQGRSGGGDSGSLRLIPPDDAANEPVAGSTEPSSVAGGQTGSPSDSFAYSELERELAEKDRLLALRNQELASLQDRLAALEAGEAAIDSGVGTPIEPEAETSPGVELESETDPGSGIFVDNEAEPELETPVAETPAPKPIVVAPAKSESFLDQVKGLLSSVWVWIGLGVIALLALLPLLARLRNRDDADSTGTWESLDDFDDEDDESLAATSRLRALASDEDSIVVVESDKGRSTAALDESLAPDPDSDTYSVEDTFSSETAINLDQSDPVAEADFHMAYGLYDQAADLISGAIANDPERRDLKEKLAEIYFVWGNQEGFTKVAEELNETANADSADGWEKIRIMGQQIAPTHALFAGAAAAAPLESVDLDFAMDDGTGAGLDVDFASEEQGSADFGGAGGSAELDDDAGLDFEFTATGTGVDLASDPLDLDTGGLFGSDDSGSTVERSAEGGDTVEQLVNEEPTVEQPLDEPTQETPTIESLAVPGDDNTAEIPVFDAGVDKASETAEINLDDLGLDLGALDDITDQSSIIEMPDIAELDNDSSIETLGIDGDALASIGEESVTLLSPKDEASSGDSDASAETMLAPVDLDDSLIASANDDTLFAAPDEGTGRIPTISDADVDLDIGDLTAALQKADFEDFGDGDETVERPLESAHQSDLDGDVFADTLAEGDDPLDLDIGTTVLDDDDTPTETRESSVPEPDNRTMTEVGTKLDLARAYIDMGDPDGARSILNEVADEGSSDQRQEARKLLDDLPPA